jgi:hypothetical protein
MKRTATTCGAMLAALTLGACGGASSEIPMADSGGPTGDLPVANANCEGTGDVEFICNVPSPEDLVAIPGTPFVVASGYAGGAIHYVSTRDLSRVQVFPIDNPTLAHDTDNFGSCPGPIDSGEGEQFSAHGLNIRRIEDGRYLLYVVHHGFRESIEFFEIDTRTQGGESGTTVPGFAWVGCVIAPEFVTLNSVSPLPGGGFVATVVYMPPELTNAEPAGGDRYGVVWEWSPTDGWSIVAGSESPGPNGIEASRDGRWLYVNLWASSQVMRLSRGQTPVEKEVFELSFHPDNVHWQADGSLFTAGHNAATFARTQGCLTTFCEDMSSHVARIDPDTMTIEEIVNFPASEFFYTSTSALQVEDEIWIGSMRGDRIARYATR